MRVPSAMQSRKDVKDSILLVHPTCGPTQPGDIDGLVRIQTYEALKTETEKEYPMLLNLIRSMEALECKYHTEDAAKPFEQVCPAVLIFV